MDSPALEVLGVSHAFGKVAALRDVHLVVPHGRFVALLGVNGAGKTTLFSLITRLYDNTSGVIRVAGHDLRRSPGKALERLGVVFQTRALVRDLTVRQNLAYHAALHGIDRATARARIAEVLAQVDLSDKAGIKVAALSGGQQRRAEIARALINRPALLLLDEATTGLCFRPPRQVLDIRLEKVFNVGTNRFGVYMDGDNLLNKGFVTGIQTRNPSVTISGTSVPLGGPTAVNAARQLTFGGRWSF